MAAQQHNATTQRLRSEQTEGAQAVSQYARKSPVELLPWDVWLIIVAQLPLHDVVQTMQTCRALHQVCSHNTIWRRLYLRRWLPAAWCGTFPAPLAPHMNCKFDGDHSDNHRQHHHRNSPPRAIEPVPSEHTDSTSTPTQPATTHKEHAAVHTHHEASEVTIDCCCCSGQECDDRRLLVKASQQAEGIPDPSFLATSWKGLYGHRHKLVAAYVPKIRAVVSVIVSASGEAGSYPSLSAACTFLKRQHGSGRVIVRPGVYTEHTPLILDFPCEIIGISSVVSGRKLLALNNEVVSTLQLPPRTDAPAPNAAPIEQQAAHAVVIRCSSFIILSSCRLYNVALRPAPLVDDASFAPAAEDDAMGLFVGGSAKLMLEDCDIQLRTTCFGSSSLTLLHCAVHDLPSFAISFSSKRTCNILHSRIERASVGIVVAAQAQKPKLRILYSKVTSCDNGVLATGPVHGHIAYTEVSSNVNYGFVSAHNAHRTLHFLNVLFSKNGKQGVWVKSSQQSDDTARESSSDEDEGSQHDDDESGGESSGGDEDDDDDEGSYHTGDSDFDSEVDGSHYDSDASDAAP